MFFEPSKGDHGLPHNPLKACVVPRPIGWISSYSSSGVANLAPYSFFNLVSERPAIVVYGSSGNTPYGPKDTVTNIGGTGDFVVNVATWDQREAMHKSSAPLPPEQSEFGYAGLQTLPARLVKAPRVRGAPIHLECLHYRTLELPHDDPSGRNALVMGTVVGVHISDEVMTEGRVDVAKLRPIARLGYLEYAVIESAFGIGVRPSGTS